MNASKGIVSKHVSWICVCLLFLLLTSCAQKKTASRSMSGNQRENHRVKSNISAYRATDARQVNRSFWKNDASERPLDLSAVSRKQAQSPSGRHQFDKDSQDLTLVEEVLSPPVSQYAADDDPIGQNTSSMIEGKIYNLIEDAYLRRDYVQFIKLYSLFVESFPHSSQKGLLDEKRKSFFYQENLKVEKLQGALLEVSYPGAKSFQELGLYFERLRDKGIKLVQMRVVQSMGVPVFLFANPQKGEGYYFSNSRDLTVDNVLEQITKMAHDNGLKIYASFPLRHHPRLGDREVFMLDESWNIFQNRTTPNSKLDLLNPHSRSYLLNLVQDLLQFEIDGIIFKDDFTYQINEGFSAVARDRYLTATGLPLAFNKMFIPIHSKEHHQYDILTSNEFQDVALWRAREITQLLWDIAEYAKHRRTNFQIGIEVAPEMLLDRFEPLKWHSTGLSFLESLNVDFYILKWRRYNSAQEADPSDYARAVDQLRKVVPSKKEIFLKIPLSQMTKNTIELNRKIESHSEFQRDYPSIKIAVGPVDRIERLDIVN